MENEKKILNPAGSQELDESLLKGVSGGSSDEDWDIKMPYKYEIGQLVLVPVLGDGIFTITARFHSPESNTNLYYVTNPQNANYVGEMLLYPIA